MNRRQFVQGTAAIATASALTSTAAAQSFPARPLRLVVGFPPGGGTDAVARLIAQALSQRLGHPVVVENRPGAGTNLATEAVVKAAPDGHTLLFLGSPQAINATLYDTLGFNVVRDIAPVASIARGTYVMVVHPSFPARTILELVAHAKADPNKINLASSGVGTPPHAAGELFKMMTATEMLHVPYRGDAPALTDLLGGRVHLYFSSLGGAIAHIKAGTLRALAVTGAARSEALPDIPAVAEFVADYEASSFWGIGAPKDTPSDIIGRLHSDVDATLADPNLKARLADLGATAFPLSAAQFKQFIADETDKWGKVVKFARIKPE
jgi:tripartite-type tricarboxylate transporter receptor subunit TctC